MDKETQKRLLIVGVGVAGVAGAYLLSQRKTQPQQQTQAQPSANTAGGVVPIPALLAQATQRAGSVGSSAPVSPSTSTPTPTTQNPTTPAGSSGLSDFWAKFGLRAYTANDPAYDLNKNNYNAVDTITGITVPNYVVDKTTLLQHYTALQGLQGFNQSQISSRLQQIQAIQ